MGNVVFNQELIMQTLSIIIM